MKKEINYRMISYNYIEIQIFTILFQIVTMFSLLVIVTFVSLMALSTLLAVYNFQFMLLTTMPKPDCYLCSVRSSARDFIYDKGRTIKSSFYNNSQVRIFHVHFATYSTSLEPKQCMLSALAQKCFSLKFGAAFFNKQLKYLISVADK